MRAQNLLNSSIAAIVFLILLLGLVHAYPNLDTHIPQCMGDGQFSFTLRNKDTEPFLLKNTQIVMSHKDLGTFPVNGYWSRDSIFQQTTTSEVATYTSTTGNLNLSGTYEGALFYNGCKSPPCQELFRLEQCPAFRYSCDVSQLRIDQCFVRGNELWIKFSGLNKGQYEKLTPEGSIAVSIESNARTIVKNPYISGMTITKDAEDSYTMRIARDGEEKFYDIELRIWNCKDRLEIEPALCTLNRKPLVERKLNASMSSQNATVQPGSRPEQPSQPTRSTESPIRIKRVRTDDTENTETEPETIRENTETPPTRRTVAVPEQESISPIFLTIIFMVWLIALMIVIVLLFKDKRA